MKYRQFFWICLVIFLVVMTGCRYVSVPSSGGVSVAEAARGRAVAEALNARYKDPREKCPGDKPLYACAGVLYRAVSWSPDYYFWNNSNQGGRYDGVSFSYLQKLIGVRSSYRSQGFIIAPASEWKPWGHGVDDRIVMFCSFAFDGMTGFPRGRTGCGKSADVDDNQPCSEMGIDGVSSFAKHYLRHGEYRDTYDRWFGQCSFGVDWKSFLTSLLARQSGALEPTADRYSEQVLRSWPLDRPDAVPIEAFYYDDDAKDRNTALNEARGLQKDYFDATGRSMPILRWHASQASMPFSFADDDQGMPGDKHFIRPPGVIPKGAGPASFH
ncbi:MAG: hypothetical protein GAK28_04517 [Luteibacter sp.]|uniref:hypothetical protein n=1 Tax=Luteibacter sp. TaxID=1886636 RepID=UPI0013810216|nr:hypothetical protein [Luteibacter sp.]KAF1003749.1 MAG: hypothetical protein GAK28_04517 [Luteibacter sp.]